MKMGSVVHACRLPVASLPGLRTPRAIRARAAASLALAWDAGSGNRFEIFCELGVRVRVYRMTNDKTYHTVARNSLDTAFQAQ